jgi:hypothetical protein
MDNRGAWQSSLHTSSDRKIDGNLADRLASLGPLRFVGGTAGAMEQSRRAPAGMTKKPPTMAVFKTMWEVDRYWLPGIRELCREAEQTKPVTRLCSLEEVDALQELYRERRS